MKFLGDGLTFDDVLLMPGYSEVLPNEVELKTKITDAIELMITEGHPVHVVIHRGPRHDLGNPGGYIRACVDFALRDETYGPSLERWLRERVGTQDA